MQFFHVPPELRSSNTILKSFKLCSLVMEKCFRDISKGSVTFDVEDVSISSLPNIDLSSDNSISLKNVDLVVNLAHVVAILVDSISGLNNVLVSASVSVNWLPNLVLDRV